MKKLSFLAVIALISSSAFALNAPVNIVYPIDGQSYHNYFTTSFSVTCPGGPHSATWVLDGVVLGHQDFYDQATVQFSQKAGPGTHVFYVKSTCGGERVKFEVLP